jgi:hypothetical protein
LADTLLRLLLVLLARVLLLLAAIDLHRLVARAHARRDEQRIVADAVHAALDREPIARGQAELPRVFGGPEIHGESALAALGLDQCDQVGLVRAHDPHGLDAEDVAAHLTKLLPILLGRYHSLLLLLLALLPRLHLLLPLRLGAASLRPLGSGALRRRVLRGLILRLMRAAVLLLRERGSGRDGERRQKSPEARSMTHE